MSQVAALKIAKPKGVSATPFELQVAKAIYDLEHSVSDLTAELRQLQFNAAKEVCF